MDEQKNRTQNNENIRKGMEEFAIRVLRGEAKSIQEIAILPEIINILVNLPDE